MTTKSPTTWIPQPLGYGYTTPATPMDLVTETGAILVTELGAALVTGKITVTGKNPTTWANTGT